MSLKSLHELERITKWPLIKKFIPILDFSVNALKPKTFMFKITVQSQSV